jgi:hypothetical protein
MRVRNAARRNCEMVIALIHRRIDVMHISMGQHT